MKDLIEEYFEEHGDMKTDLRSCARCGGDHLEVGFHRLGLAMEIDGESYGYWAPCPSTNDPVFLRVVPVMEGV